MILVDTSAWIEFLRDTGSDVCNAVDEFLDADIAICDAIAMEVLAGARDDVHLQALRGLLGRRVVGPARSASPAWFNDTTGGSGRRHERTKASPRQAAVAARGEAPARS